jgi:ribosomal protein S18 acetylase RimI-like enzyme
VESKEAKPATADIRPAREGDIDALLVVERQCFDVYYYRRYTFSRDDFQSYLKDPASIFLVAAGAARPLPDGRGQSPGTETSESRAVGYVVGPVEARRTQRTAHIDSIAVLPEVQHAGIGSRLLQAFIEQARQRGARHVLLEVAVANETGLAFFARHGFHEVRPLLHYYGRNLHGLLMYADT